MKFRIGDFIGRVEVDLRSWGIGFIAEKHRGAGLFIGVVLGPLGFEIEHI